METPESSDWNKGERVWKVYEADREYDSYLGSPVKAIVSAKSKKEAEMRARKQSTFITGAWAVPTSEKLTPKN